MSYTGFLKQAFKNKESLESSDFCGCYYCEKTFLPSKITEWVDQDQTALCPFCGIDSVVPGKLEDNEEFLKELKKARNEFFY